MRDTRFIGREQIERVIANMLGQLAFEARAQRGKGADREVEVRDGGRGARETLIVLQQRLRRMVG